MRSQWQDALISFGLASDGLQADSDRRTRRQRAALVGAVLGTAIGVVAAALIAAWFSDEPFTIGRVIEWLVRMLVVAAIVAAFQMLVLRRRQRRR